MDHSHIHTHGHEPLPHTDIVLESDVDKEPMEEEEGNHGNEDNGSEETSKTEREGSSERETSKGEKMDGQGDGEGKEEEASAMETEKKPVDLFALSAVNAYGSQEVKKIEDDSSKVYTLTSKSWPASQHLHSIVNL